MAKLQPFEGATNRTAVFLCQKGEETEYPVEYHFWKKKEKGSIAVDLSWSEVQAKTIVRYWKAQSVDGSKQGPWISAKPKALQAVKNILGEGAYRARAGSCTWLNGVYWGNAERLDKGLVNFSNDINGKEPTNKSVERKIESELLYPLLRGREVDRWQAKGHYSIIMPQGPNQPSKAIPLSKFMSRYPKCASYFQEYEDKLSNRSGYRKYLEPAGEPY